MVAAAVERYGRAGGAGPWHALPSSGLLASLALHAAAAGVALWLGAGAAPGDPPTGLATAVPVTIVLQVAAPDPPPAVELASRPAGAPERRAPPERMPAPTESGTASAPHPAPTGEATPAALPNPARKPAPPDPAAPTLEAGSAAALRATPMAAAPMAAAPMSAATMSAAPMAAAQGYAEPQLDAGARNPPPVYPRRARRLGQEGTVLLRVRVSASGRPIAVEVADSSGHPLLDEAARVAVAAWVFQPARRGTTGVEGLVEVPVVFRLID